MEQRHLFAGSHPVTLYLPEDNAACPLVYCHFAQGWGEETAALLEGSGIALAAVGGIDWNRDLSPWPAPGAFRCGEDFAGGADEYLTLLTESILPEVERTLCFVPACRMLAGYSMAGLFALYALFRTDCFCRAACVSGSLWFDGFSDFVEEHRPAELPQRVYLSLGDREARTKNQRLARIGERTSAVRRRLSGLGILTLWEQNPGGHFDDVEQRTAKGILRLAK